MRTSVAFFAGAGTILAAIGLGLGGGFTVASIVSPHPERQKTTLVERRRLDDVARAEIAQRAPVPYLAATVSAINSPAVTAPAALIGSGAAVPSAPPTGAAQPAARIDAAVEPAAKPVDAKPVDAKPVDAGPGDGAAAKSAATAQQPLKSERSSSANDANAKARDADVKRLSDKRKAERRQQWADRQSSEARRQWGDRQRWDDRQWSDRRVYRDRPEDQVRGDRDDYVERRDDFDPPVRVFGSPRLGIFDPED